MMLFVWLLALLGAWVPVPNAMQADRWAPSAALLPGGTTALVAGGYSYATRRCLADADLFDARTGRFRPCRGRLAVPRDFATATPLPEGRVLIAGGFNTVWGTLDSAEVYDPVHETFRRLPSRLSIGRELFQATDLADGRVLLTGGFDTTSGRTQASADLYDPKTERFTRVRTAMTDERFGHAAVRLADGRVLIVGGKRWHVGQPDHPLASAEIYDPQTGRFHATRGPMAVPRDRPTATRLSDGTVLIAGGQNGSEGPRLAEIFDPRTETFTSLGSLLNTPRMAHGAVTLPDGRVLLAGGWDPSAHATTTSTETYDPRTRTFTPGPALPADSHDLALIAFPDGRVLAAGGKQVHDGRERALTSGALRLPGNSVSE